MAKKSPTTIAKSDAVKFPLITIAADSTSAEMALPDGCEYLTNCEKADAPMVLHRRVVTLPELERWLKTPKPDDRRATIPGLIQAWMALRPLETRRLTTVEWMKGEVIRMRKAGMDVGLLVVEDDRRKNAPDECAIFINRGGVA